MPMRMGLFGLVVWNFGSLDLRDKAKLGKPMKSLGGPLVVLGDLLGMFHNILPCYVGIIINHEIRIPIKEPI